jgi:Xaa-Pro aminopeptidase
MIRTQHWLAARVALLCVTPLLFSTPALAQDAQNESALTWRIPTLPPAAPIRPEEFAARRRALVDSTGDGVVIVLGARAPSQDYLPYQQNPAFRFLTGVEEPDAALIIARSGARVDEWLFVQPRNPAREVWEGARLGPQGAREQTGVNAQTHDRVFVVLDSLLALKPVLHALEAPPASPSPDAELSYDDQVLSRVLTRNPKVQVKEVGQTVRALRARKSAAELDRLRRATYISAEAHCQAMLATEPRCRTGWPGSA